MWRNPRQDETTTYYDEAGSEKDCRSKPHSQRLYAMNNASPEDSMTFVRRNPNPMRVRKRNAVSAAPSRVADKGDIAAAG